MPAQGQNAASHTVRPVDYVGRVSIRRVAGDGRSNGIRICCTSSEKEAALERLARLGRL